MKSMHTLLDEAEHQWRSEVRENFPLRSDTPVIRRPQTHGRDWTFSTDLRRIFADIGDDAALQKKFETIVTNYWDGKPEDLAQETLHYLLYHELYHPLEAPFSVEGPDNDNKRIHQAIRKGLLKAEPTLSPLEQVIRVQASQNGVKDFILDNRFAVDNAERPYVRADVIPIWDALEVHDKPAATNFYTATRLLYGALYGPQNAQPLFEEKAGKDGHALAEKALAAITKKPVTLPKPKGKIKTAVASLFGKTEEPTPTQTYIHDIRSAFSGTDRYPAIERFMSVLGPYVQAGMPQGRPDMQGEGSGTSPQNILQDLLDDMNAEEQQTFVNSIMQEGDKSLQQAAQSLTPKDKSILTSGGPSEIGNLDALAAHEYYKRNHPPVRLVGESKEGVSVVVGKREHWDLTKSTILTEDEVRKINLQRIGTLQQRTRLPWLIDLGNGTWKLNEYVLKSQPLKNIVYGDANVDVPDAFELYTDSSGSMGTGGFTVNDGSRWDMLSHAVYGLIDALREGGKRVGKSTLMRVHNFANKQVSSEPIPLEQYWNGDIAAVKTFFKPDNGYNVEDLDLHTYHDGKKRVYVIATDGDLVIPGRTEREARKMHTLAKDSYNRVVLFEIGGTYGLGEAVKSDPNIVYRQVHDKTHMLQTGLEVLLAK